MIRRVVCGLLLAGVLCAGMAQAAVRYVNISASGANDGSSWANAFSGPLGVQSALAVAQSGDEIWVAQGTYKPTDGTDRSISFVTVANTTMYGGFVGTETLASQRDWTVNQTTLSGDIGVEGDMVDNVYHVVRGGAGGLVDGFVIAFGRADGSGNDGIDMKGGGAYRGNFANCVVYNNEAISSSLMYTPGGGGIYGASIRYSTISNNYTNVYGGGH